jgi:hypothetical protein
MNDIQNAASILGRLGGVKGVGDSKRRSSSHYQKMIALRRKHFQETFNERFWKRVNKNGPVPEHASHLGNCWVWTGGRTRHGYGVVSIGDKTIALAHRVSFAMEHGSIDNKLHTLHQCDNPPCIRPSHLKLGTPFDNARDCSIKERCGNMKLTNDQIGQIRKLAMDGIRPEEIANKFGIQIRTAELIILGHCRKHVHQLSEEQIVKIKKINKLRGKYKRGSVNPGAKLTEHDVFSIRCRISAGEHQRVIAKSFNVSQATINLIANRKRWIHVP